MSIHFRRRSATSRHACVRRTIPGMQIENSFAVKAAPDRVYEFLLDVNNVVSCVPGAELSEVVDPNTFKGKVRIKVGPVTVNYNGTATDHLARRGDAHGDPRGGRARDHRLRHRAGDDDHGGRRRRRQLEGDARPLTSPWSGGSPSSAAGSWRTSRVTWWDRPRSASSRSSRRRTRRGAGRHDRRDRAPERAHASSPPDPRRCGRISPDRRAAGRHPHPPRSTRWRSGAPWQRSGSAGSRCGRR